MKILQVLFTLFNVQLLNVFISATGFYPFMWPKTYETGNENYKRYNFGHPRGIYPWEVNIEVWRTDEPYYSNPPPPLGYNLKRPFYDWINKPSDLPYFPNNCDKPYGEKVPGNLQDAPTTIPDGLDPSNKAKGPDGQELPADLFGSRITPNAEGLNIQKPFYRPTVENSTSLNKCREYTAARPYAVFSGENAVPRQFPHLALLGYGELNNIEWGCGGSLISDQYILTAGHCISPDGLGNVSYIRLGEYDLNSTKDDADVRDYPVAAAITHPLYNFISPYHDIALIRLNESITDLNVFVYPACLATTTDLENVSLTISGWGRTGSGRPPASILQTANLRLVAHDRCRSIYRTPRTLRDGIVEDIHICADGGAKKSDACRGDSGGPLQFANNYYENASIREFPEIAGVVSFGFSCGAVPGVYTRVLPYVKWIESIVWPNN